jgi:tetratricopeptide (TPR) repeat protein
MPDDEDEIPEDVLAQIRRAAFELREEDPQAAVRILRTIAAQGGAAEVLARGALGEIYLEELGDLDAAESSFRAVIARAPGLPAARLGLGRTLRESGRLAEAEEEVQRALLGFEQELITFKRMAEEGEQLFEGGEETVLAVLDVAVDLADLRHQLGKNGSVKVPLDETLLAWARGERLFDATEEHEDWIRFHSLWARLRVMTGRGREAMVLLAEAEGQGELPPAHGARLMSEVLEEGGDLAGALREAQRLHRLQAEAGEVFSPPDVDHLAGLHQATGDEPGARLVLREALEQVEALLGEAGARAGGSEPAPDAELTEALREAATRYRAALGREEPPAPVQLGRR